MTELIRTEEFGAWYRSRFKEKVAARKIGREAELPLVDADGRAGDARRLWPHLKTLGWDPLYDDVHHDLCVGFADEEGTIVTTDAGVCTIEIVTAPHHTLNELKRTCDRVFHTVAVVAAREGMGILGYGVQPQTLGTKALWMPKGRYHDGIIPAIGEPVHCVTVTASDQAHICITRDEVVPATNAMNALAGAVIALMANSPIHGGIANAVAAYRETTWDGFSGFEERIGLTPHPFHSLNEWVQFVAGLRLLSRFDTITGRYCPCGLTLDEHARCGASIEDLLMHEGFLWHSARPRAAYSTIEIRPACQQPPREHLVLPALALGLIENLAGALALVERSSWEDWRTFRHEAIRHGIRAHFRGEPATELIRAVLAVAHDGLRKRSAGEEIYLKPLSDRLRRHEGPADRARKAFADGGVRGLIADAIYPTAI